MRPRTEITVKEITAIRRAMHKASSRSSFQRLQCLWLRARQDLSTTQIAYLVGLSVSHIRRIWSDYLREGLTAAQGRPKGGRHHQHLSLAAERELLQPFEREAKQGRALTARVLKKAYEERVGKSVPDSTVCRLLARQGWRRIQPRPKHPRRSKRAQTIFKKKASGNSPRRRGFLPPSVFTLDV
jgi:transposase